MRPLARLAMTPASPSATLCRILSFMIMEKHVALPCGLGGIGPSNASAAHKLLRARRVDIAGDHLETGLEGIGRYGHAHASQSDEADN